MRTHSFRRGLDAGEAGVAFVSAYLSSQGFQVRDVTGDRDYQRQDIDLLVRGQAKQAWRSVEVKTDVYTNGNVYLEVGAQEKPGCVFQSRAEWWLYYLPNLGKLLFINLPQLQFWLMEHGENYPRKRTKSVVGKRSWIVEGIAVPIAALRLAGVASQISVGDADGPHMESRPDAELGLGQTAGAA